jgi:hypothetical protein
MGSWGLPAALRTLGADDVLTCHAFLAVEISVRSVRIFDAFAEFPRPGQALAMRLAACRPQDQTPITHNLYQRLGPKSRGIRRVQPVFEIV